MLLMPGTRFRVSDSTTRYDAEGYYLALETPRLYAQAAHSFAQAAHLWRAIADMPEFNRSLSECERETHSLNSNAAWDKATEGISELATARLLHRYLREHNESVTVPVGMRVSSRPLFQKMVAAMVRRRSHPVPTPGDAATLRGMARNLAEDTLAVAHLLSNGQRIEPLPSP